GTRATRHREQQGRQHPPPITTSITGTSINQLRAISGTGGTNRTALGASWSGTVARTQTITAMTHHAANPYSRTASLGVPAAATSVWSTGHRVASTCAA